MLSLLLASIACTSTPNPVAAALRQDSTATLRHAASAGAPGLPSLKKRTPPTELFEVVKVVDGDTIHVRRQGEVQKLRLLSVDTEERLGKGFQGSATKPQTIFGEQCALWAQKFFAELAQDGEPTRVGLLFPVDPLDPRSPGAAAPSNEKKDSYGRLLCDVILPDGTDYDLLLVALGKSPYFNKYGNSVLDHDEFVALQRQAQEKQLGIWNPHTNEPTTSATPSAKRPYRELLDWWDARAAAVDDFRHRRHATPETVIDAEDADALLQAAGCEREVEVFGEVAELFDEADGDQTVLMRASKQNKAVRVRIPAELRAQHAELDLGAQTQEFRQNYAYFKGRVTSGERGFEMRSDDPARWRRAGPEPKLFDRRPETVK